MSQNGNKNSSWLDVILGLGVAVAKGYMTYSEHKKEEERKRKASQTDWGDLAGRALGNAFDNLHERAQIYGEFQRDMRNVFKD